MTGDDVLGKYAHYRHMFNIIYKLLESSILVKSFLGKYNSVFKLLFDIDVKLAVQTVLGGMAPSHYLN